MDHEWRRAPIGAELAPNGGVHFRVWAPRRHSLDVALYSEESTDSSEPDSIHPLTKRGEYFEGLIADARAGSRYKLRVDGGKAFPDPASRFQPHGPHGASEVIDPSDFEWSDAAWTGIAARPVIYELHIGTFTAEGTWRSAADKLYELAELGVTTLEVMPVAEFAGSFGWGYDGVNLFAPYHVYGTPNDFRYFINRAHELGLSVILDVVYNHFGPDGNYVTEFSESYASTRHQTDWGGAINFDSAGSEGTREFFLANATYWIREFHLDGLRLDATQNIYDDSAHHILAAIATAVRHAAAPRQSYLVAENESQDARILRPIEDGGYGLDAAWNDDWHHSASVALGGRDEAYYADYTGSAREFVAAARFGYLYQGQWYAWQQQPRGVPGLDLAPRQFVHFLENHDQVSNSFHGDRLHRFASPRRVRALTALLLLGPQTPLLFQGQEFGASSPFVYFADHHEELMKLVCDGRLKFLMQFQSIAASAPVTPPPNPGDAATFARCKLDHSERETHAEVLDLHRDLIALRRDDDVLSDERATVDGATLSENAFVLRYRSPSGHDRLLLINLGGPLHLRPMPEPLLAPPATGRWTVQWSSEEIQYGGAGLSDMSSLMNDWTIPGDCAVLFRPQSTRRNGATTI